MPKVDIRSRVIKIDTTTGGQKDISPYVESMDVDYSAKLIDDTAPSSSGDQSFRGIKAGGATLTLKWAEGDAVDIDALFSGLAAHTAAVDWEDYPSTTGAGQPKYTASAWVAENGWRIVSRVNDLTKGEVRLTWDNGWTRATV